MKKIGILTFHYSHNYGGVLQAVSLQRVVKNLGYEVEIINFIPNEYKNNSFFKSLGVNRSIIKEPINIKETIKKVKIISKESKLISKGFKLYREEKMKMSNTVNENSIESVLNNYSTIIVGSDQVWNPSQRNNPVYFLDFNEKYKGLKISYAADSTVSEIKDTEFDSLKKSLNEFDYISVRNEHSFEFVKKLVEKEIHIVADPTLLLDFEETKNFQVEDDYILIYILGKEIEGSHTKVLEKIKKKYGDLPVYSIKIPTMNFDLSPFADKVFYNLTPDGWINMFRKAKFVYTDSFHGVLFSMKYHKPFLAYYTEKLRATRFIDLGKRYGIDKYIVQSISEIDEKKSLDSVPNYNIIDNIIKKQKNYSLNFLKNVLSEKKNK